MDLGDGDEGVDKEEVPMDVEKEIEGEEILLQILKELQYLRGKQEDLEGQFFMLQQGLGSLSTDSKGRHREIMKMLKRTAGTGVSEAAGTQAQNVAGTSEAGTTDSLNDEETST